MANFCRRAGSPWMKVLQGVWVARAMSRAQGFFNPFFVRSRLDKRASLG